MGHAREVQPVVAASGARHGVPGVDPMEAEDRPVQPALGSLALLVDHLVRSPCAGRRSGLRCVGLHAWPTAAPGHAMDWQRAPGWKDVMATTDGDSEPQSTRPETGRMSFGGELTVFLVALFVVVGVPVILLFCVVCQAMFAFCPV